MDLLELRDEIDAIDKQIVELYEKRIGICKEVADYKIKNGKKVFDRVREEEKIRKVKAMTNSDFTSRAVEELFEQIMSVSRKLQYQILSEHGSVGRLPFMGVDSLNDGKVRVVFQGAEGAYSQAAMMQYFGDKIQSFHVNTFRDAMSAIEEGSADALRPAGRRGRRDDLHLSRRGRDAARRRRLQCLRRLRRHPAAQPPHPRIRRRPGRSRRPASGLRRAPPAAFRCGNRRPPARPERFAPKVPAGYRDQYAHPRGDALYQVK